MKLQLPCFGSLVVGCKNPFYLMHIGANDVFLSPKVIMYWTWVWLLHYIRITSSSIFCSKLSCACWMKWVASLYLLGICWIYSRSPSCPALQLGSWAGTWYLDLMHKLCKWWLSPQTRDNFRNLELVQGAPSNKQGATSFPP